MNQNSDDKKTLYKVLIVGQGITGTLLSFALAERKIDHLVFDPGLKNTSSRLAAGIINPITGRRLTLSPLITEMLEHAKASYQAIEKETGSRFFFSCGLHALIPDEALKEVWLSRRKEQAYKNWISDTPPPISEGLKADLGAVWLPGACRVDIGTLLDIWRIRLRETQAIREENFVHQELRTDDKLLEYKGIKAEKIIFCEGFRAASNPWFSYLPFKSNRGQRFIIEAPDLKINSIIRKYGLLCPASIQGNSNAYWFGATNEWSTHQEGVTEKAYKQLESNLNRTICVPWAIKEHSGAIRPTIKDRRPIIGFHSQDSRIGLINAMGTKGALLAPWHVSNMADHIANGKPLSGEELVSRFK